MNGDEYFWKILAIFVENVNNIIKNFFNRKCFSLKRNINSNASFVVIKASQNFYNKIISKAGYFNKFLK